VHTGTSFDNTFVDNWLKGNNQLNDGSPELLVQYYASNDTFEHNTIIATNSAHVVYGTVPGGTEHGNVSNDNSFSAVGVGAGQAQFGWSGHVYTGFAAYRHATSQDSLSSYR
jgi:hypothetical protein